MQFKPKELTLFGSPDCVPCHTVKPLVEQCAKHNKLMFTYMDVQSPEGSIAATHLGIFSIPTMLVTGKGEEQVNFATGIPAIRRLLDEVNVYFITGGYG